MRSLITHTLMLLLFGLMTLGGALRIQTIKKIEATGVAVTADVIGGSVKRNSGGYVESGHLKIKFVPKGHTESFESRVSPSASYMESVTGPTKILIKKVDIKYLPSSPGENFIVGESEIGLAKFFLWAGVLLTGIVSILSLKAFTRWRTSTQSAE